MATKYFAQVVYRFAMPNCHRRCSVNHHSVRQTLCCHSSAHCAVSNVTFHTKCKCVIQVHECLHKTYVINLCNKVKFNTLRTGDANLHHLRFLYYNCERQMTQICLLTFKNRTSCRYPPNTPFYVIFQQISILNFLNMLHNLRFSLFKMQFIS
jgi:hypothetical protein